MSKSDCDELSPEEQAALEAEQAQVLLNTQLFEAAGALNLELCQDLVNQGADPAWVKSINDNGWYSGDTSTCLHHALSMFTYEHRKPVEGKRPSESEENLLRLVNFLIEKGADVKFEAQSGNWSRSSRCPLSNIAMSTCAHFQTMDNKLSLMKPFIGAGANLNQSINTGKQGSCGGYGHKTYPVFNLVEEPSVDLEMLELYLEAGANVNCADSSWSVDFDDNTSTVNHMLMLHKAISSQNVALVNLLLSKGADVNQNMVFTFKNKKYIQSCLQLAMEVGNLDILQILQAHDAQEEVKGGIDGLTDKVRFLERYGLRGDEMVISYRSGGEGKWKAKQAPPQKKLKGKFKGKKKKC